MTEDIKSFVVSSIRKRGEKKVVTSTSIPISLKEQIMKKYPNISFSLTIRNFLYALGKE